MGKRIGWRAPSTDYIVCVWDRDFTATSFNNKYDTLNILAMPGQSVDWNAEIGLQSMDCGFILAHLLERPPARVSVVDLRLGA